MKKRWISLISTILIIGVLFVIIEKIDFYDVYLLLAKANLIFFGLAIVSMFLTFIIWNFRWIYLFRDLFKGDFWFLMHVLFSGAFFCMVTPGAGVGGEPFRAHFICKKYKRPKTKVLGYILADKFFQLIVMAFFAAFSVLFIFAYINISESLKLILEMILIFILAAIGVVIFLILKKINFKLGALFKKLYYFKFISQNFSTPDEFVKFINNKIRIFSGTLRRVVKNRNNLWVGFSLSILFWVFHFLVSYFLFLSFGHHVNFLSVAIVFTLAGLIGSLSIVPGGIGVTEGVMTLLYSAMGIPVPLALLVAFFSRLIYYFFGLVVGGYSLVHLRKNHGGKKGGIF